MLKRVRPISIAAIAAVLIALPGTVFSHSLWINLSDYSPERGRSVAYFGWGHRYPVDDLLDQQEFLKSFYLVKPSGEREDLVPNPGGLGATQVEFSEQGTYILAAEVKPGFYTMYLDRGKMRHKIGPKTGLNNVVLSQYYEQYAKAVVNVGEGSDSYSKPLGHKLEIIPLENPGKLKGCGGHFLPVQVLFKGKPLRYSQVLATYFGFSTGEHFACATSTDGEGKAKIRLVHWGPWIRRVNHQVPPTEELKDKCDRLSYTATLTFEVK